MILTPKVRETTASALGEILKRKHNSLKIVAYEMSIYPVKSLFDDAVNSITHYIFVKLSEKARTDPDPSVRKTAIKAIVKMDYKNYARDLTLIEIIFFDSDFEVRNEAIKGLKHFMGSQKFDFLRKSEKNRNVIIKKLADNLYSADQSFRKSAQIAFSELYRDKRLPREYYHIQDLKAKFLEMKIKDYDTKGIRLSYYNPNSEPKNKVPPPFENWFEVEVFLEIHKRGYIVIPQAPVASKKSGESYLADLMIISSEKVKNESKAKRLVVECEDHYHNNELEKDSRQNQTFDLPGQSLYRVKHSDERTPLLPSSSFYSSYSNWKERIINPRALDGLWEELNRQGIKPVINIPPYEVFVYPIY